MAKTFGLVFTAAFVGFFCGLAVALLVAYWEEKRPLFGRMTTEESERFSHHMRRTLACAGVVTSLLYIVLTH